MNIKKEIKRSLNDFLYLPK